MNGLGAADKSLQVKETSDKLLKACNLLADD